MADVLPDQAGPRLPHERPATFRDALDELDRLRAENDALRKVERAFAKVPQEQQARIMAALASDEQGQPS